MVYEDIVGPNSDVVSTDSYPITPDNSKDLPRPIRFIRAGTGGVVRCVTASGQERSLNILDGETRAVVIFKVFSTGTTATDLEGMPRGPSS